MSAADLLLARKQQLEADLDKLEKTIYNLETEYLAAEYSQFGTVLKGFDGFLSSKDTLRKRARNFKTEDRTFSLSSRTSPAARCPLSALLSAPAGYLGARSEVEELQQNLLELVDNQAVPVLGRGKSIAQKGYAQKGQLGLRR